MNKGKARSFLLLYSAACSPDATTKSMMYYQEHQDEAQKVSAP